MVAFGNRWARKRATSPVPVPMSSIRIGLSAGFLHAHAPSSTPSVPTFMAQRSCLTVNCLKLNESFDIFFRFFQVFWGVDANGLDVGLSYLYPVAVLKPS